ncbi:hypothetical protein HMPREF1624_05351 [Sporothrix schenckii ATCC 58251]|uniref:Uncharacterized protein n=1 Tax=Sporothrix schenckii (strain ATCC 58251 / de Perez 2211183) TaxID=1391915 RepID=U7PUF7_SPOS1|nr:hypothetical protein HMPREF1624_05351 [Sporothrix schenckii ATCC 58251]
MDDKSDSLSISSTLSPSTPSTITDTWTTASVAPTTALSTVNTASSATNSTLRPMQTAFEQPVSCTGHFSTTSYLYYNTTNFDYTHVTLAISDTRHPQFATCQPPGWDTVVPRQRFVFSPGVCPQAWTAYDLSATTTRYETTVSSAYCCSSGFTLSYDYPYQTHSTSAIYTSDDDGAFYTLYPGPVSGYHGPGCYRRIPVTPETTTMTAAAAATPSVSLEMHLPYSVQWKADDTQHMSPTPPPVPCTYSLYAWTPGAQMLGTNDATYGAGGSLYVAATDGAGFGTYVATTSNAPVNTDCPLVEGIGKGVNHGYASTMYFVMIGIPLIAVAFISCCTFLCVRGHRRNKRDKRQLEERAAQEKREVEQAIAQSLTEAKPPAQNETAAVAGAAEGVAGPSGTK